MSQDDEDYTPWRRLAAAVILRALEDVWAGRPCTGASCSWKGHVCAEVARDFLMSDGAAWLLRQLDLNPARLGAILASGPIVPGGSCGLAEASRLSGYSPHHLKDLVRAGDLEGGRDGRQWWVDLMSLETYARSRGRKKA